MSRGPTARIDDVPLTAAILPRAVPGVLAVAALTLAACDGGAKAGDSETFCTAVIENLDELRSTPADHDDVEELIRVWRDVGDDAPLAVERDWEIYADMVELAWTGDDEDEILAMAFSSERSAVSIATWLGDNCGVDWGPVTTIVPQAVPDSTTPAPTEPAG